MEPATEISFLNTLLPLAAIVFIIAIGVVLLYQQFHKNLYRNLLEKEELEKKYQHDLLHSSIQVQELERKRIAHDLHDEIGAMLTTSKLYFNQINPVQSEERLAQLNSKMNFLFDEMLANIRRISHDLRPVVLETLGLKIAVEGICENLNEAGLSCDFAYEVETNMSKEAEMLIYRILQELIGNTIKHANASNICIEIYTQNNNLLNIHYRDNGSGFNENASSQGLGLKSIASRLSILGGKMNILASEKGASILMEIDIRKIAAHE